MTSDKLQKLFKMLERQPSDPFLLYGIGMEYKKLADPAKAIEFYGKALDVDPNYCYAYYQRGQVEESTGNIEAAKQSYQAGLDAAKRTNDAHAQSELQTALDMIS